MTIESVLKARLGEAFDIGLSGEHQSFIGQCSTLVRFGVERGEITGEKTSKNLYMVRVEVDACPSSTICLRVLTVAAVADMNEEHSMNGSIAVDGYTILGSDQVGDRYSPAGNISLMISLDDLADAQAKFRALAEGGQVWMPFGETF